MLTVPQWWGGGEYELLSMWAQDKAGKTSFLFRTTHPVLENAVVNMTQDDTTHDETPPTLFSVWIDKTEARLGEEVTVSVIITDDMSGVGTVAVNFTPIPSYIDRVIVHLKPRRDNGRDSEIGTGRLREPLDRHGGDDGMDGAG